MRRKIWEFGLIMTASLLCSVQMGVARSARSGDADTSPCVTNITSTGSFARGRTFRTFQDFPNVTRAAAFDRILVALATDGWTVATSSKEAGVITSWAKPNFSKGETESLNAVIRDKAEAGIRVDLTYIAPAMAHVPKGGLQDAFCKIMAEVQSATTE